MGFGSYVFVLLSLVALSSGFTNFHLTCPSQVYEYEPITCTLVTSGGFKFVKVETESPIRLYGLNCNVYNYYEPNLQPVFYTNPVSLYGSSEYTVSIIAQGEAADSTISYSSNLATVRVLPSPTPRPTPPTTPPGQVLQIYCPAEVYETQRIVCTLGVSAGFNLAFAAFDASPNSYCTNCTTNNVRDPNYKALFYATEVYYRGNSAYDVSVSAYGQEVGFGAYHFSNVVVVRVLPYPGGPSTGFTTSPTISSGSSSSPSPSSTSSSISGSTTSGSTTSGSSSSSTSSSSSSSGYSTTSPSSSSSSGPSYGSTSDSSTAATSLSSGSSSGYSSSSTTGLVSSSSSSGYSSSSSSTGYSSSSTTGSSIPIVTLYCPSRVAPNANIVCNVTISSPTALNALIYVNSSRNLYCDGCAARFVSHYLSYQVSFATTGVSGDIQIFSYFFHPSNVNAISYVSIDSENKGSVRIDCPPIVMANSDLSCTVAVIVPPNVPYTISNVTTTPTISCDGCQDRYMSSNNYNGYGFSFPVFLSTQVAGFYTLTAYVSFGQTTILANSTTVNIVAQAECGQKFDFGNSGLIVYMPYNNSAYCTWTIQQPFAPLNSFIDLFFPEIDTEIDRDFLYIYDGPNVNYPLIPPAISGHQYNTTVRSTGPAVTLKFVSDNTITKNGFIAQWTLKQRSSSTCNGRGEFSEGRCQCYSGYSSVTNTDCDNSVSNTCTSRATTGDATINPPSVVLADIYNNSLGVVISSYFVVNRTISTLDVGSCKNWFTSKYLSSCNDSYFASIPLSYFAACNISSEEDSTFVYYNVPLDFHTREIVSSGRFLYNRTLSNSFNIQVSVPKTITTGSSVEIIETPVAMQVVIVQQSYDYKTKTAQVDFIVVVPSQYYLSSDFASIPTNISVLSFTRGLTSCDGSVCQQNFRFILDTSRVCALNGEYSVEFSFYCRDSACTSPSSRARATMTLTSSSFCGSIGATVSLNSYLASYSDSSYSVPQTTFRFEQIGYFKAIVQSSVTITSVRLVSVEVRNVTGGINLYPFSSAVRDVRTVGSEVTFALQFYKNFFSNGNKFDIKAQIEVEFLGGLRKRFELQTKESTATAEVEIGDAVEVPTDNQKDDKSSASTIASSVLISLVLIFAILF